MTVSNLRDLTEIYKLRDAMKNKEEKSISLFRRIGNCKKAVEITNEDYCRRYEYDSGSPYSGRIAPMESTVMISGESGTGKK
ncbi:MAG: hypothetical protein ACLTFJ_13275 [Clostridium sp.]